MRIEEAARQTPVIGEYELVVLGGGPAGIAAALAAARRGVHVLLVERYGFLGGMGTAGGVTNFAGLYGFVGGQMQQVVRGVADDVLAAIDACGGLNAPQDGMGGKIRVRSYDVSAYKIAADALLKAAGVELLLHALCVGAQCVANRVRAIFVETKSGRGAIVAEQFIDASGDADLAHHAGVEYCLGDGAGSGLFPTLMFRVGDVEPQAALAAVGEFGAIDRLIAQVSAQKPGRYRFPREGAILRPQKSPTQWRVNVTQIKNSKGLAVDATNAQELSCAEQDGRLQVLAFFEFLRAEVPGFERCSVIEIAPQIGIRESRRVHGVYRLSGEDILSSARFEDAIGLNAWPMEIHANSKIEWRFPRDAANTCTELPWRMLQTPEYENLLIVGRCASMTHEGQSAARASGACFAMGQAAGTAAALAAKRRIASRGVAAADLQAALRADGAYFFSEAA